MKSRWGRRGEGTKGGQQQVQLGKSCSLSKGELDMVFRKVGWCLDKAINRDTLNRGKLWSSELPRWPWC